MNNMMNEPKPLYEQIESSIIEELVMYKRKYERVESHVRKAVTKHPKFCDRITTASHQGSGAKLGRYRDLCRIHGTAEYILLEECYGAIHAYNKGNKEHAIDECYDAIAVLMRMVDFMEGEIRNEAK